ncbi:stage II sporulation protein D [Fibrobacter sp. UWEL]|nr:stage II sporulation protein D [Fibrobacter sp. UWEL]
MSLWPTLTGAQAFSASDDDFELPEFEPNPQNFKPIEATSTTEPAPEPPKATVAKEPAPETFKPVATPVAPAPSPAEIQAPVTEKKAEIVVENESAKVQAEAIPENLDRPLRVGVFVGVKELYLNYAGETIKITPAGKNIKLSSGSHSMEMDTREFSNEDGTCLAVAPDTKSLKQACYPGVMAFRANNGKLDAINIVDVEDYLRGVVPYEIGRLDTSRIEALKAQAVAARTYAYKHFNSREAMGFDVYADTKDQVYKGLESATVLTDQAVKATAGVVMMYNNDFIIAYYHSTCGGVTETLATWNRPDLPYLKSTSDLMKNGTPYCKESSYTKWERNFTDKEILEMVKSNANEAKAKFSGFKPSDIKKIKNISIKDKLKSGRILTLIVKTDKGEMEVLTDRTRWLFKKGGSILPSSFFTIKREGSSWKLTGTGFGHGVGMCQMGVRARAKDGQSYEEILTHYYQGITLEKFQR